MTDFTDDDLIDLRQDLRERKKERTAGFTLARLHDDLSSLSRRVDVVEVDVRSLKGTTPSGRPEPPRRRLDSIAEVRPTDPPALAAFKQEDLAPVVAAFKVTRLLWKVAVAFFALAATVVTTYAAVKGLK